VKVLRIDIHPDQSTVRVDPSKNFRGVAPHARIQVCDLVPRLDAMEFQVLRQRYQRSADPVVQRDDPAPPVAGSRDTRGLDLASFSEGHENERSRYEGGPESRWAAT